MPTMGERLLSEIKNKVNPAGIWTEEWNSDYDRFFVHVDPNGPITVVEVIYLPDHTGEDDMDLPFTGMYGEYGMAPDGTWWSVSEALVDFEENGEGMETHSWPEGYATFDDLLNACGIPLSAKRFDSQFEHNK